MKNSLNFSKIIGVALVFIFAMHNKNLIADPLITFPISVNEIELRVEVANEPSSRALGLMHRNSLSHDRGMLFVFPVEKNFCIWMKNTPIDWTVLFADKYGHLISIEHRTRNTLDSHFPASPAMFALEVNQNSPVAKAAKPGDFISGLGKIPSARK